MKRGSSAEAAVEIHERSVGPQAAHEVLANNKLTRLFKQRYE